MSLENKLKLVIFDMDGLMLDTEIVHYQTWLVHSKEYGFDYDIKKRLKFTGMTDEAVVVELSKEMGSRELALEMREKILKSREEYFSDYKGSLVKDGLIELIDYLDKKRVKKAIASSSGRDRLEFLLEKEGLLNRFDSITTREDVKYGKPSPDIFLKSRGHYDYTKDECLILEDSENGYLAAKSSGIPYMIVPDDSFDFHNLTAKITYKNLYEVKENIEKIYF